MLKVDQVTIEKLNQVVDIIILPIVAIVKRKYEPMPRSEEVEVIEFEYIVEWENGGHLKTSIKEIRHQIAIEYMWKTLRDPTIELDRADIKHRFHPHLRNRTVNTLEEDKKGRL